MIAILPRLYRLDAATFKRLLRQPTERHHAAPID
jgi:hypothetical protein